MGNSDCQPIRSSQTTKGELCVDDLPCCSTFSSAHPIAQSWSRNEPPSVDRNSARTNPYEDLDADVYPSGYFQENSVLTESYFTREVPELLRLQSPSSKDGWRQAHLFRTGAIYRGQWKGNFRHGFGVQLWPDGAEFSGCWVDNRADGLGRFLHPDGSIFIGEWKANYAKGHGILYDAEGPATYSGQWEDDLQHGRGVESLDGGMYSGQFMWGKKHGRGRYTWPDKSTYVGEWHGNSVHGNGKYTSQDGRTFSGVWDKDVMHGLGRYSWPDGRAFSGEYVKDFKEGFGVFTWNDGKRFEGFWVQGKQHGHGIMYAKDGSVFKRGHWQMGEPPSDHEDPGSTSTRRHDLGNA